MTIQKVYKIYDDRIPNCWVEIGPDADTGDLVYISWYGGIGAKQGELVLTAEHASEISEALEEYLKGL